jgi:hydroxymethylpyrimidine pyrophosphatase-like HAD family hydrolase
MNPGIRYAIFFDLDGTLYFNGQIPEQNRQSLLRIKSLGHLIFLNTGRSRGFIPAAVLSGIAWDGLVAGAGYAELNGEAVLEKTFTSAQLAAVTRFGIEHGLGIRYEGVEGCWNYRYRGGIPIPEDPLSFFADGESFRITNITFDRELADSETASLEDFKIINMTSYCDVFLCGLSKATAMEIICRKLGMGSENCIAFGDGQNDLDMFQYASISVALPHTPAWLDPYITFRTQSDESGVSEGLARLFPEG